MSEKKTCCFVGHRTVEDKDIIEKKLFEAVENLIINEKTDTFLFGSKSVFDSLCWGVVTELKEKYPYIKRVYIRSAFPHISDRYTRYLLKSYEETYFPESVFNAGRASYIKRNQEMINKADICVMYYIKGYAPPRRKMNKRDVLDYQPSSGTAKAYEYAKQKKKEIINVATL